MGIFRRGAISGRRHPRRLRVSGPDVLEGRTLTTAGLVAPASHRPVVAAVSTPPTTPSGGIRALPNLVYTNLGGQTQHLDLYLPTGPAPAGGWPVVLALPGGGWRWVRRSDLGVTVSQLARYGYAVAVADYAFASPKAGSHIWPTDFEDVRQAVRWLKTNAGRFKIDPTKVAVWGESAGAHLGNLLGADPDGPLLAPNGKLTGQTAPNQVSAAVQAVIDFYGPTDLITLYAASSKDRPFLQTFLGGTPTQYPAQYVNASPVSHVSASTPPFLIYQGTADTAVVPAQAAELDQALTKAGVTHTIEYFPNVPHGFRLNPIGNIELLPQILSFLQTSLNPKPAPSVK